MFYPYPPQVYTPGDERCTGISPLSSFAIEKMNVDLENALGALQTASKDDKSVELACTTVTNVAGSLLVSTCDKTIKRECKGGVWYYYPRCNDHNNIAKSRVLQEQAVFGLGALLRPLQKFLPDVCTAAESRASVAPVPRVTRRRTQNPTSTKGTDIDARPIFDQSSYVPREMHEQVIHAFTRRPQSSAPLLATFKGGDERRFLHTAAQMLNGKSSLVIIVLREAKTKGGILQTLGQPQSFSVKTLIDTLLGCKCETCISEPENRTVTNGLYGDELENIFLMDMQENDEFSEHNIIFSATLNATEQRLHCRHKENLEDLKRLTSGSLDCGKNLTQLPASFRDYCSAEVLVNIHGRRESKPASFGAHVDPGGMATMNLLVSGGNKTWITAAPSINNLILFGENRNRGWADYTDVTVVQVAPGDVIFTCGFVPHEVINTKEVDEQIQVTLSGPAKLAIEPLCEEMIALLRDESFAGRAPLFKTASQICSSGEPSELTCAAIEDVCNKLMRLKNGETVEMFE